MKKWTEQYSPEELILHDSENFLIANKLPGIPSQPDKTGDISMLEWLQDQLSTKLHIQGRLDRPVSGALVFTKRADKDYNHFFKKYYLAVAMRPSDSEGTLIHHMIRDGRAHKARIVAPELGRRSELKYRIVQELNKYVVLEVQLKSGRFHQIRAQLAHIGSPIKGDVKYGARRKNPDRSIDLHAYKIAFQDSVITAPLLERGGVWDHINIDVD